MARNSKKPAMWQIENINIKSFNFIKIIMFACFLYLISLTLIQTPFVNFEDDAGWLLPSIAWDMSIFDIENQFMRDVGERGAISLNVFLRLLYLVFGNWALGYQIVGILIHTIFVIVFYKSIRIYGLNQLISLHISLLLYVCSVHFHAIYWIIGTQHILSMISIFILFNISYNYFKKCVNNNEFSIINDLKILIIFILLSFNRASILIGVMAITINFLYYEIKLVGLNNQSVKYRFYIFYIASILIIPMYSLFQLARGGEGWQIAKIFSYFNINLLMLSSFSLMISFYIIILIVGLFIFIIYKKLNTKINEHEYSENCFYVGIILVIFCMGISNARVMILPSILENIFMIPEMNFQRWFQLNGIKLNYFDFDFLLHSVESIIIIFLFVYSKPKTNKLKIFMSLNFLLIAFGLLSFNPISNQIGLDSIPSRYTYYFTPGIIVVLYFSIIRIINDIKLNDNLNYFEGFLFNKKMIIINFFSTIIVIINCIALYQNLLNYKLNSIMNNYVAYTVGELIHAKFLSDGGRILKINIKSNSFENVILLKEFIPLYNSIYNPLYFIIQTYLLQIGSSTRFVFDDTEDADLHICQNNFCDKNKNILLLNDHVCKNNFSIENIFKYRIDSAEIYSSKFINFLSDESVNNENILNKAAANTLLSYYKVCNAEL